MTRKLCQRWWLAATAAVLASVFLTGCGSGKKEKAEPVETKPTKKLEVATMAGGEPVIIDPLAGATRQTNGPTNDADRAWMELQEVMQTPDPPEAWMTKEPSPEEVEGFKRKSAELLAKAAVKAREFYTKYPEHENAAEARQQEYHLLNYAAQLGDTNGLAQLTKLEAERLSDPKLSEDERLQMRVQQLQRLVMSRKETNTVASVQEMDRGVRALQKEFPKRTEVWSLALLVAQSWLEEGQPEKSRALATEVANAEVEDDVKEGARALLKTVERLGKPLALKFTAVDGREVDLQKLKGKVVLVDFWATWCAPCMAELPRVKDTYTKLKAKGFEIVGISFDQDKEALERVVTREKLPWPQFFDDRAEHNKFGDEFGISSIPAMWLVDKQGVLRAVNAREKLAEQVEKLLAEK